MVGNCTEGLLEVSCIFNDLCEWVNKEMTPLNKTFLLTKNLYTKECSVSSKHRWGFCCCCFLSCIKRGSHPHKLPKPWERAPSSGSKNQKSQDSTHFAVLFVPVNMLICKLKSPLFIIIISSSLKLKQAKREANHRNTAANDGGGEVGVDLSSKRAAVRTWSKRKIVSISARAFLPISLTKK